MIYVAMPVGAWHGWGVCGKYVTLEMARFAELRLLTDSVAPERVGDELDGFSLAQLLITPEEEARLRESVQAGRRIAGRVLQCIPGKEMLPFRPGVRGDFTLGYAFFEDQLSPEALRNAGSLYDHVATGSTWCTEALKERGLSAVSTVIQGVDTDLFEPSARARQHFPGRFVVFSGGKFELRKGQDLVIRAYKVLQDKYPDVMLLTAWMNLWTFSRDTMAGSPYIRFVPSSVDHVTMLNRLLSDHGIDVSRTVHLKAHPNSTMARIYKNTDVGLFPNRCEGGTNLVLMEYMACGKPAIASFCSGHKDILTAQNSLRIENVRSMTVRRDGAVVGVWDDPSLDETIALLEHAYQHRETLQAIGQQAGCDMAARSWRRTAEQFHTLLRAGHAPSR